MNRFRNKSNGLGQRIYKYSTNTYISYDDAGHPLGEYTYHGPVVSETLYVGDIPVAFATSTGAYAINTDHLNSPRVITDGNGNFVSFWNFVPFGERGFITSGKPVTYNARFPGQYYDAESGLHYNGFRDYDPTTGRYIESDPIGLKGGVNTYGYVGGNPVNFVDHSGLCLWDGCVVEVTAGVIVVTATIHWTRNYWNDDVSYKDAQASWTKMSPGESIYHTQVNAVDPNGAGNEKYVSPNGNSEAVFSACGSLVTNPTNQASYNYFSPYLLGGIPHGITDVIPYYIFGNTPSDMLTSDRFKTTWNKVIEPKLNDIGNSVSSWIVPDAY